MATNNSWNVATGTVGSLCVGQGVGTAPLMTNTAAADFTFTTAVAAGTRVLTVSNTDNTNTASNAKNAISVGGASGGDAFTTYSVNGVTDWSHGIDNSDSDAYVLAASSALGTTNVARYSTTGVGTYTGNGTHTFTTRSAASFINLFLTNTDTVTAGSGTSMQITNGGTSSGTLWYGLSKGSTRSYAIGMPALTNESLSITTMNSAGVSPEVGTQVWNMTSAGVRTMPLQPAFLAYLASTATNKTGNGTAYTLGTDALTEVFDRGTNFNTNGTFTAPVTGIYDLRAQVTVTGTTIATTFVISIVTTDRTYTNTFIKAAGSQDESVSISALCDMTATNTATVTITVSGEAADTADILGAATVQTFFCGSLVC